MGPRDCDSEKPYCNMLPGHSDCKNQCDKGKCKGLPTGICCGRINIAGANNDQAAFWMQEAKTRLQIA